MTYTVLSGTLNSTIPYHSCYASLTPVTLTLTVLLRWISHIGIISCGFSSVTALTETAILGFGSVIFTGLLRWMAWSYGEYLNCITLSLNVFGLTVSDCWGYCCQRADEWLGKPLPRMQPGAFIVREPRNICFTSRVQKVWGLDYMHLW